MQTPGFTPFITQPCKPENRPVVRNENARPAAAQSRNNNRDFSQTLTNAADNLNRNSEKPGGSQNLNSEVDDEIPTGLLQQLQNLLQMLDPVNKTTQEGSCKPALLKVDGETAGPMGQVRRLLHRLIMQLQKNPELRSELKALQSLVQSGSTGESAFSPGQFATKLAETAGSMASIGIGGQVEVDDEIPTGLLQQLQNLLQMLDPVNKTAQEGSCKPALLKVDSETAGPMGQVRHLLHRLIMQLQKNPAHQSEFKALQSLVQSGSTGESAFSPGQFLTKLAETASSMANIGIGGQVEVDDEILTGLLHQLQDLLQMLGPVNKTAQEGSSDPASLKIGGETAGPMGQVRRLLHRLIMQLQKNPELQSELKALQFLVQSGSEGESAFSPGQFLTKLAETVGSMANKFTGMQEQAKQELTAGEQQPGQESSGTDGRENRPRELNNKTARAFNDQVQAVKQQIGINQSEHGQLIHVTNETGVHPVQDYFQPVKTPNQTPYVPRMVHVILGQVVQKARLLVTPGITEMQIQLKPEFLGKLDLSISSENGQVTARFNAENYRVKEVIEANLNQLRDALAEQGVKVDQLQVNVGTPRDHSGHWNRGEAFYGGKSGRPGRMAVNSDEFERFLPAEAEAGIIREYYGSTVDFKA